MRPIDRSPSRVSAGGACAIGALGVLISGGYSWASLAVGTVGIGLLLAGVVRGRRGAVTVGAAAVFIGALVAGAEGAPAGAVLAGVTAGVVAWDAGATAIDVGAQLGRAASTARIEVVHLAASVGVGCLTAGIGYLGYVLASGGQPLSALLLLLVAAILLLTAVQFADRPSDANHGS